MIRQSCEFVVENFFLCLSNSNKTSFEYRDVVMETYLSTNLFISHLQLEMRVVMSRLHMIRQQHENISLPLPLSILTHTHKHRREYVRWDKRASNMTTKSTTTSLSSSPRLTRFDSFGTEPGPIENVRLSHPKYPSLLSVNVRTQTLTNILSNIRVIASV